MGSVPPAGRGSQAATGDSPPGLPAVQPRGSRAAARREEERNEPTASEEEDEQIEEDKPGPDMWSRRYGHIRQTRRYRRIHGTWCRVDPNELEAVRMHLKAVHLDRVKWLLNKADRDVIEMYRASTGEDWTHHLIPQRALSMAVLGTLSMLRDG